MVDTFDNAIQCRVCGRWFNPALLSEVFEHEHLDIETDGEYFGELKDEH